MIKEIFHFIYCMSIPSTMLVLITVCCLWSFFQSKAHNINRESLWRISNFVLFFIWLFCVVYMTVLSRGSITKVNLTPFHIIIDVINGANKELLRVGWMNILLFVPGGMWLSYATQKQTVAKRVIQIFLLISISIMIEALQWYYKLGTVETDDVICNSLGAIIGVTSDIWARKLLDFLKNITKKAINCIKGKINKPR